MTELTLRRATSFYPLELGYIRAIKNIWKQTFQIRHKIIKYVTTVVILSVCFFFNLETY
jgi:transcriptional regulatory protein LevR